MEVPSPAAGKVAAIEVKVGDKVSEGSLLLSLETASSDGAAPAEPAAPRRRGTSRRPTPTCASRWPCSAAARAATRPRSARPTSGCPSP